jgi:3D (Asp-Asp-Asp) domain-containing protein
MIARYILIWLLTPLLSSGGPVPTVHFLGRTRITCYLPTGNLTKTGTKPHWGTVAVDPRVIPLGASVLITGVPGLFHAEDTGGLVRGRHVDVFVTSWIRAVQVQGQGYRQVVWWIP